VSGLLESLHLLATTVFVLGSAVVGLRLLWLARQTRQAPELLLGGAILGTAVLGYGVLIAALLLRGEIAADPAAIPPLAVVLTGLGNAFHDAGVTLFLLFVIRVFRPEAGWARGLAGGALLLLWGGLLGVALQTGFRADPVGSAAWMCRYAVIWTYPLWILVEALRYWSLMRRRVAVGLADPAVANRFLLWGGGSLFTALAIWSASVPLLAMGDPELLRAVTPPARIATAIAGVISVTCSYLAFLPPAWYLRWIRGEAAGSAARA